MDKKPNCYECVHRGEVPGSAHSCCLHPAASKSAAGSPFMQLAGIMGKRGGAELMAMADSFGEGPHRAALALNISGHERGVRGGWFIWPVNFDPVWLQTCTGFSAREQPATVDAVATPVEQG